MSIHIAGTNQEVFDRVCAHLAQQGKRAVQNSTCQYRTPDGLRCAIGGLLPDDADFEMLDSLDWPNVRHLVRDRIITIEADEDLLSNLQHEHDSFNNSTPGTLRESLVSLAFQYNLDPAATEQIKRWEA